MRVLLILTLFLCSSLFANNTKVLNVLNWSSYMPPSVISAFEKKTGITVNYNTFDSDDELYTKLALQPGTYDIIGPASYMITPLRKIDSIAPLNKKRLRYFKDLNPLLVHNAADPQGNYCLPNFWGTSGIVINDRYYNPKTIHAWQDLWHKQFRNTLLIPDDDREAFNIALIRLGYSPNDNNPQHIKAAYRTLQNLLKNIKIFNEASEASLFADDDVVAGVSLSGDAYHAAQTNPHLHYIYPQPRVAIWLDCLAISNHAPHLDNAYRFLNFIMQPKIAAQIAQYTEFATPNVAAKKYLPKKMRESKILYPSKTIMQKAIVEKEQKPQVRQQIAHYWQLLKLQS